MNYRSLKITNFRAINSLEAEDFKRVNLLTGRNNCGKTTVLEALFLISGMSNPQLPIAINKFRNLMLNGDDGFSVLFNELDFSRIPEISAEISDHTRSMAIKPKYSQSIDNILISDDKKSVITHSGKSIISTIKAMTVSGIIIEFSDSRINETFKNEFLLTGNQEHFPSRYKETLACQFYNAQFSLVQLDMQIESLLVNKQLDSLITILKEIDDRISDLRIVANGIIYADVGYSKLIPINIMGDGIVYILSIIVNISSNKDGILLRESLKTIFLKYFPLSFFIWSS